MIQFKHPAKFIVIALLVGNIGSINLDEVHNSIPISNIACKRLVASYQAHMLINFQMLLIYIRSSDVPFLSIA